MFKKVSTVFFDFFVEREVVVHKRLFTVPNLITVIGILLIGVYVYSYVTESWTYAIPLLIIAIGLSDLFDGLAARLLNQHSYIGKIMDPARDRLLLFAIMVNIVIVDSSIVVLLTILSLVVIELLIIAINLMFIKKTKRIGQVHTLGKLRMAVHGLCSGVFVVMVYWPGFWEVWAPVNLVQISIIQLLSIMIFASVVTLSVYFVKLLKIV